MNLKLYKNYHPAVSIILPTFNRADLISKAIKSVQNQSISDWELIIVDDGSYDNTFDIVRNIQEEFNNVRYLRHSNRNLPISLNSGIQSSCGKFITFLGSDDEYQRDHLKLRLDYMKNSPDVDLIHGGVKVIGNPYVKDKNDITKEIHLSKCIIGGTFFGKRNVFIDLAGFEDIHYSEDSEFYDRASKKINIEKVAFPTYIYYRNTPDSISNSI